MDLPKILPNMVIKFLDEEMHTDRLAVVTGESSDVFYGYAIYNTDTRYESNDRLCIADTVSVQPQAVLEVYVNNSYDHFWFDAMRMVPMLRADKLKVLCTHPNLDDDALYDFRIKRIYVKEQIKEVTMSDVEEKFGCKVKIVK